MSITHIAAITASTMGVIDTQGIEWHHVDCAQVEGGSHQLWGAGQQAAACCIEPQQRPPTKSRPATAKQVTFMTKLAKGLGVKHSGVIASVTADGNVQTLEAMTSSQASQAIELLLKLAEAAAAKQTRKANQRKQK